MSCCWGEEDAPTVPPSPSPVRRPVQVPPAYPTTPVVSPPRAVQLTPPPSELSFSRKPLPPGCIRFTYMELCGATGSFAGNAVLGEGGFGKVYRGTLECGRPVAIKRLDRLGLQGDKEFEAEVTILARLRHSNLVTLLGACTEARHRLAVFDYMPGGSLRDSLEQRTLPHSTSAPPARLLWPARVGIALGAARGLNYLHEGTQPGLIHRDVKSSNVLIDSLGHARIADFGLALHTGSVSGADAAGFETAAATDAEYMTGTFGYNAPEYLLNGRMSQKSDVYSFGVILLELLTGKPPVDPSQPVGSQALVDFVLPILRSGDIPALQAVLDPVMPVPSVPVPQLAAFSEVAIACLEANPKNRPRMQHVVKFLEAIAGWREVPSHALSSSTAAASALLPSLQSLMDAPVAEVPPMSSAGLPITPLVNLDSFLDKQHAASSTGLRDRSDSAFEPTGSPRMLTSHAPSSSLLPNAPSLTADLWPSMAASSPTRPLAEQRLPRSPFLQPPLCTTDSASQLHGAAPGDAAAKLLTSTAEKALAAEPKPRSYVSQSQSPASAWATFGEASDISWPSVPTEATDPAHLWPLKSSPLVPRRKPPAPPQQC